ncbi:hypothetical protein NDU88_001145 [Pleurodeles waltl]|uniref:Uncharacterized protein n=1 Tax=Pleurodeles waltl TaxID=8319 RepID=A0AAV7MKP8_PLEWA|nr:hypothetical protein NDU88_001145 [Pleurodeles waltl]
MHPSFEAQSGITSLETIYRSIMEHREESKSESRKTQLACRKMQMSICRVAKTCSEYATRMGEVETRISKLEDNTASQGAIGDSMKARLDEAQWKLVDLEDKRNNLRVLGVPEGVKGTDPRGFIVSLFKEVFPDLIQWYWEREIQRAHLFPFNTRAKSPAGDKKSGAMLISLLNFQAKQAVYDLACPDHKRTVRGLDFFC